MVKMTKIIIIEHDPAIVTELKMHLQYLYCDVISVVNSEQKALELFKTASENEDTVPDVILLDIGLHVGLDPSVDSVEPGSLTRCSECNMLYYNAYSLKSVGKIGDVVDQQKRVILRQIPIVFIAGHKDIVESISQEKLNFLFCYVTLPISTRDLKLTIDMALHTTQMHSQRQHDKQEIAISNERYKALVDNMVSGVAIFEVVENGDDFILLDMNKSAELIEGKKREDNIGKSIFQIKPGITHSCLIDIFKTVLKTGKAQHPPITLYKDNTVSRYYDFYVYRLSSGEIVCLFRDETLKKLSEEEMNKLQLQLNQAQKMEAIGIMAGGIAHDFNNILFPIIGSAEMLIEESKEGSTQRTFLNEILKAGYRAKELVKQILTFSRQEQHEVIPLSIEPIVKEIIKLSRAMIPSTIKINHYIPKNSSMVMADPTQIHQLFMNLIINAFHAMEDTGGTLTIRLSDVANPSDVKLKAGNYISIEISDTGIGMDKATQQRIFEPYFTTKGLGKGTGLGLSVVHGIVKGCKGDIVLKSEIGKGTTFKIYLPGIEYKTFKRSEKTPLPKATGSETIMVVDDEPIVGKVLGSILERAGYKVLVEIDSLEALEAFREKPDMYHLIITDLTMPELTGDKLCASLKMIKPNIPVILCTGFSSKIDELQKGSFGIDRVIMKPVVGNDLLKTVRELLD